MPLDFPTEYETSEGPLDVSKSAGSDDEPLMIKDGDPEDELLEPNSTQDESEILRRKNPLGYTITPPTEEEIEENETKPANSGG